MPQSPSTPIAATNRSMAARLARAVVGAAIGIVFGLGVGLGIVVYEARFENRFIESTDDILGRRTFPIAVGLAGGAVAGWAAPAMLVGGALGGVGGGAVGALTGAVVGDATSNTRSGLWAGGVMGGAFGIVAGVLAGIMLRRFRRPRSRAPIDTRPPALLLLLGPAVWLGACGGDPPQLPDVPPAPVSEGDDAESVLLLFGDPGRASYLKFPILPKIAAEVEHWSDQLDNPSSVVVVVLGDIIYPDGMHPPGTEGWSTDSTRVESQMAVVRGERARAAGARLFFVAGNHDWGLMEDRVGTRRLKNLGEFVDRARERRGVAADLVPDAGTGMPHVVDLPGMRLVLLDTAWWIFDAEPQRKEEMIQRLAAAIATAGGREVIIAAHHPFATAGPHGGEATLWKDLGIRFLLARSGAMLQSLDSRVYEDLRADLERTFARVGRPLAFVGGHEHSLQVIRHDSAAAPQYSIVSGSASKLTPVGWTPGMLFRRSAPGYVRIVSRASGAVDIHVVAAPEAYLVCPEDGSARMPWAACLDEGVRSYRTVFSMRLKESRR